MRRRDVQDDRRSERSLRGAGHGLSHGLRQEHLRNNPAHYLEMLQANENRPKIGDRLGEIRCPTLIIVGEHDVRTPVALSEDLNKAIPGSLMKIVPNCGHFYSYEQPEPVSHTVLSYLAAFGATGGARGSR